MTESIQDTRDQLKMIVGREIRRLAKDADVYVFALYNPRQADMGPIDYICYDRHKLKSPLDVEVDLEFEGIGVWYICFRNEDTFTAKHILLRSENGRFNHQQTGTFDGFWEDWPTYVSEDKWVQALVIDHDNTLRAEKRAAAASLRA